MTGDELYSTDEPCLFEGKLPFEAYLFLPLTKNNVIYG
jgi:hypothetical protein